MKYQERKVLNMVNEIVAFMLDRKINGSYIYDFLDEVIKSLPHECSNELFSNLYKMQYSVILHIRNYK